MEQKLKAVVLAAGKGTRLQSDDNDGPKVMRIIHGKPMLWYVLQALSFIAKDNTIIVAGYKKDEVADYFGGYRFAIQTQQLGTGHAVMAAETELLGFPGNVLVCCGDMPAMRRDTYQALAAEHFKQGNDCTVLAAQSDMPLSFGRIVRGCDGVFEQIVEEKDCTPQQREITELNSGVYIFRAPLLLEALKLLKNDNSQGEYYLTDVPAILRARGCKIGIVNRELGDEILGVNTPEQLEQVERILSTYRETTE